MLCNHYTQSVIFQGNTLPIFILTKFRIKRPFPICQTVPISNIIQNPKHLHSLKAVRSILIHHQRNYLRRIAKRRVTLGHFTWQDKNRLISSRGTQIGEHIGVERDLPVQPLCCLAGHAVVLQATVHCFVDKPFLLNRMIIPTSSIADVQNRNRSVSQT